MGAVTAAMGAVFLVTQTALAAVTWSTVYNVGPSQSWNDGMSLARSSTSTTTYLHAVYATDVIGGVIASDAGPHPGAYYTRGNSTGSTWGTAKRLNPNATNAVSPAVVASGKAVYAAYVTLAHWDAYDPAEPRTITVRVNSSYGSSTSWLSRTVTAPATRVDRPAMAAWGTNGFMLVYTNADTGEIVLMTCGDLTIAESGCTGGTVGTTTRHAANPADGFEGMPVVAAYGSLRGIAWLTSDAGGINAIATTTSTFAAPTTLTTAVGDGLSAAAYGSRFAVSWAQFNGVKVRVRSSGTWQTTRTVSSVSSTSTYKAAYTTAVTLVSTGTVGVAFAACRRSDCAASSTTGVDLRWRESSDLGATWKSAVTVAAYSVSSARRFNDFPSVLMSSTTKRYVMWNGASSTGGTYRVLLRVGNG